MRLNFHDNLRPIREAQQMTQQELARLAKVSVLQIKRYESGESEPTLSTFVRICAALDVDVYALIEEAGKADVVLYSQANRLVEQILALPAEECRVLQRIVEALVNKHRAERER